MHYHVLPECLFNLKDDFIYLFPQTIDCKWELEGRMDLKRSKLILAQKKEKEKGS